MYLQANERRKKIVLLLLLNKYIIISFIYLIVSLFTLVGLLQWGDLKQYVGGKNG